MIQESIRKLVERTPLGEGEVAACVEEIVRGDATQAQIGAFLVALRSKGETPAEIAAFASSLRRHSVRIEPAVTGRLVDTCGTGGDAVKTFNVSTISAFVTAGADAKVAKHGNRSVTSRCGSADLMEKLGFNLSVGPDRVKESIEQLGIGFMFAPNFHPAMKKVAPVRKELGIRTIFNLMGPLINPAAVKCQVVGVYSKELVPVVSQVLRRLGVEEAIVVHGLEGMDEISIGGKTLVSRLRNGEITTRECSPEEFGIERRSASGIGVADADSAARLAMSILEGSAKRSIADDMVVANAGAALVAAGLADGFRDGTALARASIESGAARKKLDELVKFSGGEPPRIGQLAGNS